MAAVVLADLVQKEQFGREAMLTSIRRSVFWGTGVIYNDADLTAKINADVGTDFEWSYFLDLADTVPNIGDDSNNNATPDNITTASSRTVSNFRTMAWAAKVITADLSLTGDPIVAISGRIGAYWGRRYDMTAMAIVEGVLADNIANDASDMVHSVTGVAVDINAFIDAGATAGDEQDGLGLIIAHSAIVTSLRKQGITDRIYSDNGEFLYEALIGMRIMQNDSVPTGAIAGLGMAAGDYLSYIVSPGLIGYGNGSLKRPEEVSYDALTGMGMGEETLVSRKSFIMHPKGFSFLKAVMASTSPTEIEFSDATNWSRDIPRKSVKLAALISAV